MPREILSVSAGSMFGPCFDHAGEPVEALGTSVPAAEVAELRAVGVDDKLGEVGGIRGVVIAEARTFSTSWRGRFNRDSLKQIIELWPAEGLKSAAQHPSIIDDGLFNYLGRIVTPRMSRATYSQNGETSVVPAVRGDLAFDPGARNGPRGDLAAYISERVRSDPRSLSTSLIVAVNKIDEVDAKGRPKKGKDGEELPPLWMPLELLESDVVAVGDAVSSILSPSGKEEESPPYDSGRDALLRWWRHRLAQHQEMIGAGSHGTSS